MVVPRRRVLRPQLFAAVVRSNVIVWAANIRFMCDSLVGACFKVSSVALLLVVGCGSGSGKVADGGQDVGGGGVMDTGGGGDVPDAGGAVDAPTDVDPASLPPSCLVALFAACPTDTACVRAAGDGGNSARQCYANGVKTETTGYVCSSVIGGGQSTDVTKPDGSLCYGFRHSANTSMACEVEQFVWTDAAHTTVATGTLMGGNQALTITCAVGGDSATYYGITSPAAQGWFTTPCTAGACP
jgi:hypothetical protein